MRTLATILAFVFTLVGCASDDDLRTSSQALVALEVEQLEKKAAVDDCKPVQPVPKELDEALKLCVTANAALRCEVMHALHCQWPSLPDALCRDGAEGGLDPIYSCDITDDDYGDCHDQLVLDGDMTKFYQCVVDYTLIVPQEIP